VEISNGLLNAHFPKFEVGSPELRGYVWKVVVDPTRSGNDPGLFYGRLFRMIDIRINRDEKSTWPEGICFEHVCTYCLLTYKDGLLFDLTNSKEVERKKRVRDRKRRTKSSKFTAR